MPIALSGHQLEQYAVPLIRLTMGDELGDQAEGKFDGSEYDSWGLWDRDRLIAIIGLGSEISPQKVWLGYFAVHPDYRKQGIGTKLLNYIEQEATQRGYKQILVETYEHPTFENAIKLYQKQGYQQVGSLADYLNDDSDALYLRKQL